jgi:flavin-dependent dehydrogenase
MSNHQNVPADRRGVAGGVGVAGLAGGDQVVDVAVVDVAVLGGGLAGLTFALHLRRARPGTRVAVVERHPHPVPEAAFKVGESTGEVAEHYFRHTLGLGALLKDTQIRKMGLRYFMSDGRNDALWDRPEIGPRSYNFTSSYQLDRGRFENDLARLVVAEGIRLVPARVERVALDAGGAHSVTVNHRGASQTIMARWVVDATGRRGMLRKQLGLTRRTAHDVNAAWWRLADQIHVDDWPADAGPGKGDEMADWCRRVPEGMRWRSTNHLMGRGYWVWLIPLSSGSISVGIVADPRFVPAEEIADFPRALKWLDRHEPQLARAVRARQESLLDFAVLRHLSYSTSQMFSADRWGLIGEAASFLDPLYSPGSDFIALANQYLVDLVRRDLDGDPRFADRVSRANASFLRLFDNALHNWNDKYVLMGNPLVWTAKAVWDTATYFAVIALNFISAGTYDLDFMADIAGLWARFHRLNIAIQAFFNDWDRCDAGMTLHDFVDLSSEAIRRLNAWLLAGVERASLARRLEQNIALLELLAVDLMAAGSRRIGVDVAPGDIDPYRFQLNQPAAAGSRSEPPLCPHPDPDVAHQLARQVAGSSARPTPALA